MAKSMGYFNLILALFSEKRINNLEKCIFIPVMFLSFGDIFVSKCSFLHVWDMNFKEIHYVMADNSN